MLSILNLGTILRRASSDKQTFLILVCEYHLQEQKLAKCELVDGVRFFETDPRTYCNGGFHDSL
jgi:hypothetical protein